MSNNRDTDAASTDLSEAIQWPDDVEMDPDEDKNPDLPADPSRDDIELACRLTDAEQAKRRDQALQPLLEAVVDHRELEDGYAMKFEPRPGLLRTLAAFIDVERQCCPFFRFELSVTPDKGPIWLELGASPHVKDILAEEFELT